MNVIRDNVIIIHAGAGYLPILEVYMKLWELSKETLKEFECIHFRKILDEGFYYFYYFIIILLFLIPS